MPWCCCCWSQLYKNPMSSSSRLPAQHRALSNTLTKRDKQKLCAFFSWKIIYRFAFCWQTWWKQIVQLVNLSINRPIQWTCSFRLWNVRKHWKCSSQSPVVQCDIFNSPKTPKDTQTQKHTANPHIWRTRTTNSVLKININDELNYLSYYFIFCLSTFSLTDCSRCNFQGHSMPGQNETNASTMNSTEMKTCSLYKTVLGLKYISNLRGIFCVGTSDGN